MPTTVHIIEGDRWAAAMLLHPDEASPESYGILPPAAEAAWTEQGAVQLAELLPEQFADLRSAISARFTLEH